MDKQIRKYSKLYHEALKKTGFSDIDEMSSAYENRLRDMYDSPAYKAHNIYPTIAVELVYAVIAMCLELKGKGLSDREIMDFSDVVFLKRKLLRHWKSSSICCPTVMRSLRNGISMIMKKE